MIFYRLPPLKLDFEAKFFYEVAFKFQIGSQIVSHNCTNKLSFEIEVPTYFKIGVEWLIQKYVPNLISVGRL